MPSASASPRTGLRSRRLFSVAATLAVATCAVALGATSSATAASASPCPDGATYNKATKQCETSAITYCPPGSDYDPATGLCTAPATYNCPDAGLDPVTYNSSTGNCETPVCYHDGRAETGEYQGQQEGTGFAICQFEGDEGPTTLTCPPGDTYTLDPETGMCTAPAEGPPECAVGSYDAERDVCVAGVAQFACPQHYQYNAQTGKCQTAPVKASKPPKT